MNSNSNFSCSSWNYGSYSMSNPYFVQGNRPSSNQYRQPNVQKVNNYSYSPTWTHTSGYTVWGGIDAVNSNHNTAAYISRVGATSKVVSSSTFAELTVTIVAKELGVYT